MDAQAKGIYSIFYLHHGDRTRSCYIERPACMHHVYLFCSPIYTLRWSCARCEFILKFAKLYLSLHAPVFTRDGSMYVCLCVSICTVVSSVKIRYSRSCPNFSLTALVASFVDLSNNLAVFCSLAIQQYNAKFIC